MCSRRLQPFCRSWSGCWIATAYNVERMAKLLTAPPQRAQAAQADQLRVRWAHANPLSPIYGPSSNAKFPTMDAPTPFIRITLGQ